MADEPTPTTEPEAPPPILVYVDKRTAQPASLSVSTLFTPLAIRAAWARTPNKELFFEFGNEAAWEALPTWRKFEVLAQVAKLAKEHEDAVAQGLRTTSTVEPDPPTEAGGEPA